MATMPYTPPFPNSTCSAQELKAIAAYGVDLAAELSRFASETNHRGIIAPQRERALYLSACIVHGQVSSAAWTQTRVQGVTPQVAWRQWYAALGTHENRTLTWIEDCPLPCNNNSAVCAPFKPPTTNS
eukprot:INCI9393.2.p1 GENE.INCI9393.2~~INCI9393.2.p1  ORF type:complete len:128 (+),score=18.34 INCI9393.2:348-731(+)